MRLHRIALRDVRGVRHADVTLADAGVTVIEGPNEVGKSTLVDAVDLLFRYKATSKAATVKGLQPDGRDVGPAILVEFSIGGARLRYRKQFLRGVATELTPLDPPGPALTGDEAHRHVDALLDAHQDRALWGALRFLQSGAPDAAALDLTSSTALRSALDAAAGRRVDSGDHGLQLLTRIEAEYHRYFTARGAPREELARAQTHAESAVEAHGQVLRTLERYDAAVAEVQRCRPLLAELEQQVVAAQSRVEAAVAAEDEATRAAAGLTLVVERRQAATVARDHAVRDERARHRLVREVAEHADALAAAQVSVAPVREAHERAAADLREARAAADRAAEADTAARQALDAADAAWRALHTRVERDRLAAESTAHQRAVADLRAATDTRDAHPVDAATLRDLERAAEAVLRAEAALEAGTAHLRVERLGPSRDLRVDGRDWSVDDAGSRLLDREAVVEVPGAARISITPAADTAALTEDATRARAARDDLLARHGVVDLDAARRAAAAHTDADREVQRLSRVVEHGTAVQPRLAARLQRLETVLAEHDAEGAAGEEQGQEGEDPQARLEALDAARSDVRQRAQEAAVAHDDAAALAASAQRALESAAQARTVAEGRAVHAEQTHVHAASTLQGARDEAPDAVLAEAVTAAQDALTDIERHEREERARVTALDVAAQGREVGEARAAQARRQVEHREATEALGVARGLVEAYGGVDLQASLRDAHADAVAAAEVLASVQRSARAARTLRETVLRHRDRARARYAAPLTTRLRDLGTQVYGPGFDLVVDETLAITARRLDGVTVAVEQLSAGAREQLGVLVRIAVAGLVDPHHGAPVVIDDALGFTDPVRLQRMAAVLSAVDGPQVLLLTCDPERHAAVTGARRVRLGRPLTALDGDADARVGRSS